MKQLYKKLANLLAFFVGVCYITSMVIRMRHTRAHTANRRSHHALKTPNLSICSKCQAPNLRHRACPNCGEYRGMVRVDTMSKTIKKDKKSKK